MPTSEEHPIQNPQAETQNLLDIVDLRVYFRTDAGLVRAVDGLSLSIAARETLGLVGESGCGKSVTANAILQLLDAPPVEYAGGAIRFRGENLLALGERELRRVRGNLISMVFQEPMSSLNPIMSVGRQISEAILEHQAVTKQEAGARALAMLRRVQIPSPESRFKEYPHQMSGGMKQRVMIAMALACKPQLLIADEPTTALDVTIQAQILDLLNELQSEMGMSILLITHDLGVVAETCDRVAVMYAGKIVERAPVSELFAHPKHPYTHGLFRSLPILNEKKNRLAVIPGAVPSPLDFPSGCRFRTRCAMAQEICLQEPPLREIAPDHLAACHFAEQVGEMARGSL
jgi:peptide/nickel transport system ATP-binding protein